MKKLIAGLSILLLTGLAAVPVYAATFEAEESFSLGLPLKDDLYVAGNRVKINEDVDGDLLVAGAEIYVRGDVGEDLTVAGAMIRLQGRVGDDLRVAGSQIEISGNITDDLIVFGANVTIAESAVIGGDLIANGGIVNLFGKIQGDANINGGLINLDGTIEGGANVWADELDISGSVRGPSQLNAQIISLSSGARLLDDVRYYRADGELDFGDALAGGVATYDETLRRTIDLSKQEDTAQKAATVWRGIQILSAILIILLLVLTTKKYFVDAEKRLVKEPAKNLWRGLSYFILTPVVAILFMVTVIGMPIGLAIVAIYVISIILALPVTSLTLAKFIDRRYKLKWNKTMFFMAGTLIYLILRLIALIPVLGPIIILLKVLAVFGALVVVEGEKWRKIA